MYSNSAQAFIFIPTALALVTSLLILFYISFTSNFFIQTHHLTFTHSTGYSTPLSSFNSTSHKQLNISFLGSIQQSVNTQSNIQSQRHMEFNGNYVNDNEVFHDRDDFMDNYKEMNRSLKIYVYPHQKGDPFSNVLLAVDFEPGGNYATESYFKKVLVMSHFITKDPSNADLFFLPFSIARLRHDPRVGIDGIKDFIKSYIFNISHEYPYWNRTNGADHFYVACHSIGRFAMEKAIDVKINAIQVVCSSSYFVSAYIPHKDASLPQIWPRLGDDLNLAPYKRDLCSTTNQEAGWPWRMIWKNKIPYKVNCFSWLLAKEAVLTHENLNKRGFHLCSRCYLCGEQAETVNHLFFLHCKVTDQLWQFFLKIKKINWVKSGSIKEVMKCWNRDGNAAKKEERWKIVPASIWWTVWKERNQRCFEDKQSSKQKMKMNCLAIYYFWCKQEMLDQTVDILTGCNLV
ncbi:probable glycosyltransferase At3g07620 [Lycium barbarum]|uniref:probable glycosyltransferase At3g07620 n=1 Tax=Lycium barbarum TaxID=112863 RepID=UPI00293F5024|nr:probable glycosyltransferase At3g07620 [Lycium barbarum]